jgi:stage V sporulation protein D (sporulation-specific penicillin-binding protein)
MRSKREINTRRERNGNRTDKRSSVRHQNRSGADRERGIVGRLVFLVVLILLAIAYSGLYRVWAIKLKYGKEYEAASINNQVNQVRDKVVNANRGDILDRNHEPLAVGNTVFNIVLDVKLLAEQSAEVQATTLDDLAGVLEDVDIDEIKGYLVTDAEGNPAKNTHYCVIAKKVEYTKGKAIDALGYSWLYSETDTKRTYTNGTLAAQILGFMRGDSSWGLESEYNDYMLGTPGRIFRTYEADGSVVTQLQEPVKGNTLITTIDQTIQQYADDVCKEAYNSYTAEYTAAIVMNPNTGEVYAMAQYPGFDANSPMSLTDFDSKADLKGQWDSLTDEERSLYATKAWKNFAISETFEPGSIYKPIVVAMAIEEGIISPSSTFVCGGAKQVADHLIHCHNRSGHGTLDVQGILANSCNVGMMDIIEKMSPEVYYKYHRDFGFHQKTGIDLPGETAADSSALMYTLDRLNSSEMATSSFGQGFNCTAIQILTAFNATINGGKIMKPYVVSQIVDAAGNIVKENSPQVVRQVISEETSDYLRKAMQAVVSPEGTGKKAIIQGYAMGGKTGTAEQGTRDKTNYTLSFIGYLSVDNPDIVVMTIIHRPEGYYDGCDISPAPMLKSIMEKIIQYEAIPPTGDTTEDVTSDTDTVTIKDYKGQSLKNTIQELVGLGLDFEILGSGGDTITSQHPEAGTAMEKGGKVLFNTETKGTSELISVPDVTGLSETDAKQMLEAVGFSCYVYDTSTAEEEGSTETTTAKPADTESTANASEGETDTDTVQNAMKVTEQSPAAGKKVEAGTLVQIKLAASE